MHQRPKPLAHALGQWELNYWAQLALARTSANPLASLKMCLRVKCSNLSIKHLQSPTTTLKKTLVVEVDLISSMATEESISISRLGISSLMASTRPSLRALNLVWMLVMIPNGSRKAPTQSPLEFWNKPPPPAKPGLPNHEPSMFSLAHPKGEGFHLIGVEIRFLVCCQQGNKILKQNK